MSLPENNTISNSTNDPSATVTQTSSSNPSSQTILIKVQIPSMAGYQSKRFNSNVTVREVIEKLSSYLPPNLRSNRYHLYANGMRLIDESRTLTSYTGKRMVSSFFLDFLQRNSLFTQSSSLQLFIDNYLKKIIKNWNFATFFKTKFSLSELKVPLTYLALRSCISVVLMQYALFVNC
jgi:hypothetical protein